jgi:hypothetical protein
VPVISPVIVFKLRPVGRFGVTEKVIELPAVIVGATGVIADFSGNEKGVA